MKIKPLFDRVLLQKVKTEQNNIGKIMLPDITNNNSEICEVVAIGSEKLDNKAIIWDVKVGDKVLYNKYAGAEFNINKETYILIKQCEILAILKEQKND